MKLMIKIEIDDVTVNILSSFCLRFCQLLRVSKLNDVHRCSFDSFMKGKHFRVLPLHPFRWLLLKVGNLTISFPSLTEIKQRAHSRIFSGRLETRKTFFRERRTHNSR